MSFPKVPTPPWARHKYLVIIGYAVDPAAPWSSSIFTTGAQRIVHGTRRRRLGQLRRCFWEVGQDETIAYAAVYRMSAVTGRWQSRPIILTGRSSITHPAKRS